MHRAGTQASIRAGLIRSISAAALGCLAGAALAQEVGTAGAVNPASTGTPPARPTRVLELGARIIHKERIRTESGGNVQLVFVDKSTMSIGPNSDVVIDEFVYDPNAGTGRMAATVAKGIMRFVGGNTSHTGGATVRTPSATLGIRGGVATISHDGTNGTKAIHHYGVLTVSTAAGTEVVRRPGFVVSVPSAAAAPTPPRRVTQAEMAQVNQQLTSKPGQSGGVKNPPSPARVEPAAAQVAQVNSAQPPQLVASASTAPAPAPSYTTQVAAQEATQEVAQQASANVQQQAAEQAVEERRQQQQQTSPRSARAYALVTTPDPALNSPIPYVAGSAVASGPVHVSPILGYRNEGTEANPNPRSRWMQVAFGVNGQGTSQTSNFMVATGTFDPNSESGRGTFSGGFRHATRRQADISMGRANGSVTSMPGSITLDGDRLPDAFRVNADDFSNGIRTAQTAFARPGGGEAGQNYTFEQPVGRATPPTSLGQPRPADGLVGFAGGMVRTLNVPADTHIEPPVPLFGGAALQLDPSDSRMQLNIYAVAQRSGATPTGGLDDAELQFGNLHPGENARGTYIDYENFAAREAATNISANGQTPVSLVNGQALARHWGLAASSGSTGVQSFFPGVTFCQCEYTRWGFWSQETRRDVSGVEYSDRTHLGTWVAGRIPDAVEIPTTGTATYTGHVIASFHQQTGTGASPVHNEYIAGGNLTNTVNFGTRLGQVTVSNLDNRSYAGTVDLGTYTAAPTPYFFGALAQTTGPTAPAAQMNMSGYFYRGPAGPVQEMGGQVSISGGPGYSGSGIFAGRRLP